MENYNQIKEQLDKVRKVLSDNQTLNERKDIKSLYGIKESEDITQKYEVGKTIEDEIEDSEIKKDEYLQSYRISGGILAIHGEKKSDTELTTEEKMIFQETMDEFVSEVSDLANFAPLNLYSNNVEWAGKIVDFDLEFKFTIGESNGIYISGQLIQVDENFLDTINKLQNYYQKFKSKWAKVIASRKKTNVNK